MWRIKHRQLKYLSAEEDGTKYMEAPCMIGLRLKAVMASLCVMRVLKALSEKCNRNGLQERSSSVGGCRLKAVTGVSSLVRVGQK
jgi:hypothetical protein